MRRRATSKREEENGILQDAEAILAFYSQLETFQGGISLHWEGDIRTFMAKHPIVLKTIPMDDQTLAIRRKSRKSFDHAMLEGKFSDKKKEDFLSDIFDTAIVIAQKILANDDYRDKEKKYSEAILQILTTIILPVLVKSKDGKLLQEDQKIMFQTWLESMREPLKTQAANAITHYNESMVVESQQQEYQKHLEHFLITPYRAVCQHYKANTTGRSIAATTEHALIESKLGFSIATSTAPQATGYMLNLFVLVNEMASTQVVEGELMDGGFVYYEPLLRLGNKTEEVELMFRTLTYNLSRSRAHYDVPVEVHEPSKLWYTTLLKSIIQEKGKEPSLLVQHAARDAAVIITALLDREKKAFATPDDVQAYCESLFLPGVEAEEASVRVLKEEVIGLKQLVKKESEELQRQVSSVTELTQGLSQLSLLLAQEKRELQELQKERSGSVNAFPWSPPPPYSAVPTPVPATGRRRSSLGEKFQDAVEGLVEKLAGPGDDVVFQTPYEYPSSPPAYVPPCTTPVSIPNTLGGRRHSSYELSDSPPEVVSHPSSAPNTKGSWLTTLKGRATSFEALITKPFTGGGGSRSRASSQKM